MVDMMILAGLLAVLLGVLYAIYLIPPVKGLSGASPADTQPESL